MRGEQAFEQGYFHTQGRDVVTVPAGAVTVQAWRGPEWRVATEELRLAPRRDTDAPGHAAAARRPAGARLVGRRPARPHELRRALPEPARPPGLPGAGGGPPRRREPGRQQGAAHPRHRRVPHDAGAGLDAALPARARPGVPHRLLGPHRAAGPARPLPAAGLRRPGEHRVRQPRAHQRRRGRPGPRAGRADGVRAPLRRRGGPRQQGRGADVRAARGRRPGQGGLPRGDGVQRPPRHVRGLVPPAELRLPHRRRRGHRRLPELRVAAGAGRPSPHVREGGTAPRPRRVPGRPPARPHVRDQRAAA